MLYLAINAALALSGAYKGSKSVLGETITAELNFQSTSTVDIDISGVASVGCPNEQYSYDGVSKISLPKQDQAGDCVHDNLAANKASISSISYDASHDEITVTAKYKFISIAVQLSSESALSLQVQQPTEAEHMVWFEEFKTAHTRHYPSAAEEKMRYATFRDNLEAIAKRNADRTLGKHFINEFSDLSSEEFKARFLGYKPKANVTAPANDLRVPHVTAASVDWRSHSPAVLTPVKNQGQCGSCWAFSATEQIETDVAMATGQLFTLSPQQITSCDHTDLGCNGGNTETAYKYVIGAGGLVAESDYPYTSGTTGATGRCRSSSTESKVATIGGYQTVSRIGFTESHMVSQIQTSPLSVCVDAEVWQTYSSGIVGSSCGKQLDHCVQAVGLNVDGDTPYWIVRNSWGTSWGNSGYIYVQQGINACGIAKDATVTTGAKVVG